MRMYLRVTPEQNVDGDRIIIDPKEVFEVDYNWRQGVEVRDRETGREIPIIIRDISILDHSIIIGSEPFLIVSAVSKEE